MSKPTPKYVIFRAFRATENSVDAQRYLEGHSNILKIYGVTKVASTNAEWMDDEGTYVLLAESKDGKTIYGGARMQIKNDNLLLPIEEGVGDIDSKVYDEVRTLQKDGVAELCGLWNSKEVAGMGVGSIFLSLFCVSLAELLNVNCVLALCSPATVKNANNLGFEAMVSLGDNGEFYYPKEGLVATAMMLKDPIGLSNTIKPLKKKILGMRNNAGYTFVENTRMGDVKLTFLIKYD